MNNLIKRFYLVDNSGNVLGEYESRMAAELALGAYTDEQIEQDEIEIIEE